MKTKNATVNGTAGKHVAAKGKRITVKGKRMVLLDESEFDRLQIKADEFEPIMPKLDAKGNYPLEALRIGLALRIVRHRRKAGLTQADLARLTRIRPETLNRIEQGLVEPSTRTIKKIEKVLSEIIEEYDEAR